jgi:hypothetical protein
MTTFWLNGRDDMAEKNDSMVCKFVPRKKKTAPIMNDSAATLTSKTANTDQDDSNA